MAAARIIALVGSLFLLIDIVVSVSILHGGPARGPKKLDPREVRRIITNDLEAGTMSPWYDTSPGDVKWSIEDWSEPVWNYSAPRPSSGTKYLRAKQDTPVSFGMAVLRSLDWLALPGDQVSLSFWIRSRYAAENTLEVLWLNGTQEVSLVKLSQFSSINNLEWRTASAVLPITSKMYTSLVIYGYCGSNPEAAIAIDNLSLVGADATTTTRQTTTPQTTTQATTEPTTTKSTVLTTVTDITSDATTVAEPATTTEEPATTTEEPATTTEEPATTTEEPATTTEEPATTTDEPITTTAEELSTTEEATTTTTTAAPERCPESLVNGKIPCQLISGICYCFSTYLDTWYNAEATCNNAETPMKLVSIESLKEQDYIANHIQSIPNLAAASHFWSSLSNQGGVWSWSATGRPLEYTNWAPQQPGEDSQEEHCARLRKEWNYQWESQICWFTSYFICEGN